MNKEEILAEKLEFDNSEKDFRDVVDIEISSYIALGVTNRDSMRKIFKDWNLTDDKWKIVLEMTQDLGDGPNEWELIERDRRRKRNMHAPLISDLIRDKWYLKRELQ